MRFARGQRKGSQQRRVGGFIVHHGHIHHANVAGVADGAAVGQQIAPSQDTRRAYFGDHKLRRSQHRANEGGAVGDRDPGAALAAGMQGVPNLTTIHGHLVAAREVGGRSGRQCGQREDHRVGDGPIVHDDDVGQQDVARIADGAPVGQDAPRRHGVGGTNLAHGNGWRRQNRAGRALRVGDGHAADTPAGGGRGAGGETTGWRQIAAGETRHGAGRERGRREDRRGPAQIVQDNHVGQRDVAGVAHRAAVGQQPAWHGRSDRADLGHGDGWRRHNRTDGAGRIGDRDTADALGGGGRNARGGATGWRQIAAGETCAGAGRQRGRRKDRRGSGDIIEDHHVGESNVARVADRAAVGQQPAGNHRIDRADLGHGQERRRGNRAGRAGRVGDGHAAGAPARGSRGAGAEASGRSQIAAGVIGDRAGRKGGHRQDRGGTTQIVQDHDVGDGNIARIADRPAVSQETAGNRRNDRADFGDRQDRRGVDRASRARRVGDSHPADTLAGGGGGAGGGAIGRRQIAAGKIGDGPRRQHGRRKDRRAPAQIIANNNVGEHDVARVADGAAVSQQATRNHRIARTVLSDSQDRRGGDRTRRAGGIGDGHTTNTLGGGGRSARVGASGRSHIAAREIRDSAGRHGGRREDRRAPASVIEDHHVGEHDVARVADGAAVSQQAARNHRIARTVLSDRQDWRGRDRTGRAGGVGDSHAADTLAGGGRGARGGASGRSHIAAGVIGGRAGRKGGHRQDRGGATEIIQDHDVGHGDVACIAHGAAVSQQAARNHRIARTVLSDSQNRRGGDRTSRAGCVGDGHTANTLAGGGRGAGGGAIARRQITARVIGGGAGRQRGRREDGRGPAQIIQDHHVGQRDVARVADRAAVSQ